MDMKITYHGKRKKIVGLLDENCPKRECFAPGYFQHRSYNGGEGSMIWTSKELSCLHCDYHGCPDDLAFGSMKNKKGDLT